MNTDLKTKLEELSSTCDFVKKELAEIEKVVDMTDIQQKVLFLCLIRIVKYFDAYLLLANNGYGEPAACVLRSVFEATLWMRWCIIKPENAELYFKAGSGELRRLVEKNFSRSLLTSKNTPDPQTVKKLLKDKGKDYKFPPWESMAKETQMDDLFNMIYPLLSAMSHGTWMFLCERLKNKEAVFTPFPDSNNIEPFISFAYGFLRDGYWVCKTWVFEKKIYPAPNYRKLRTQEEDT